MSPDAHNLNPISDLHQKTTDNDPGLILSDNPKAPPLPNLIPVSGFPIMGSPFDSRNVSVAVESFFERVRINGVSPTFKGNSVSFEIPNLSPTDRIPFVNTNPNIPNLPPPPNTLNHPVSPPLPATIPETIIAAPDSGGVPEQPTRSISDHYTINDYATPAKDTVVASEMLRSNEIELKTVEVDGGVSFSAGYINAQPLFPDHNKGVVPVILRRGDGAKVCLSYVSVESSFVVEGAESEDHTTTYPDPADYYTALTSELAHPWRVTANNSDPVSWDVVGDPVWTQAQGDSIETLWFSDAETGGLGLTNVVGDAGYILLKITRDEDSREATEVSLEFADEVPESDYYYQYRVIAYVDSEAAEPILQKQFEEIRIFEDLAVVNGEFQLVGLEMSHRNYYELPPA